MRQYCTETDNQITRNNSIGVMCVRHVLFISLGLMFFFRIHWMEPPGDGSRTGQPRQSLLCAAYSSQPDAWSHQVSLAAYPSQPRIGT